MDCIFEVDVFVSRAWGYAGGDFSLAVADIPGLTTIAFANGRGSGGDIIGRQLTARKVFAGGKKGITYRFGIELADAGGFKDTTMIVKRVAV